MGSVEVVIGPPGTGKTSWISEEVRQLCDDTDERGIYVCSFTRAAAREAAGRVDLPKESVGTLHSFAFHLLGSPKIAEAHIREWNTTFPALAVTEKQTQVEDAKAVDPYRGDTNVGDTLLQQMNMFRAQQIPREQWPADVRTFENKWHGWRRSAGYLDFTDLLEHCLLRRIPLTPVPRVLFVDEVQDLSPLEYALVQYWGQDARLVLVGDPWQCLYSFKGAHPDVIFLPDLPTQVLSQSYRVPHTVHRMALSWMTRMPGFRAIAYQPRQAKGGVREYPFTYQDAAAVLSMLDLEKSTLVLGSCGYMVDPFVEACREQGLPFSNPWRPSSGKWNPLGHRRGTSMAERLLALLRPSKHVYADEAQMWTADDVALWIEPMQAKGIVQHGSKTTLAGLTPEATQYEIWAAVQQAFHPDHMPPVQLGDDALLLRWWYERLLSRYHETVQYPLRVFQKQGRRGLEEAPRLHIGTIHSVKGGEAEQVVLFPDLSPAGVEVWESPQSTDIYRTFYVGMTRAKETLYCCLPVWQGVQW